MEPESNHVSSTSGTLFILPPQSHPKITSSTTSLCKSLTFIPLFFSSSSADAKTIKADGQDVAIIEVTLKDKNNNPAYLANNRVDFEVSGEAKIIGTDNGDAACLDNFKLPSRTAYLGRCIAIVQSNGNKGKIKILVKVKGIPDGTIEVMAE